MGSDDGERVIGAAGQSAAGVGGTGNQLSLHYFVEYSVAVV